MVGCAKQRLVAGVERVVNMCRLDIRTHLRHSIFLWACPVQSRNVAFQNDPWCWCCNLKSLHLKACSLCQNEDLWLVHEDTMDRLRAQSHFVAAQQRLADAQGKTCAWGKIKEMQELVRILKNGIAYDGP